MNGDKNNSDTAQSAPDALKIVRGGVGQGRKKDFGQLLLFETDAKTHPVDYALQSLIRERQRLIARWDKAERQNNNFAMAAYERTITILESCYYRVIEKYTDEVKPKEGKARLKLIKPA
jgi:hypothetical protein